MANIDKRAPSVGALVYKSTARKHAQELQKFNGRWTKETHAAAGRMAAKPIQESIPAPVMRKLWRLTGGWKQEWKTQPAAPLPVGTKAVYFVIKVNSELTVYVTDLAKNMCLVWRGQVVASNMHWNNSLQVEKFSQTGERHEPPPPPPPPPPPKVPLWKRLLRPFLAAVDKATGKAVRQAEREQQRLHEELHNIAQTRHDLVNKLCELKAHEELCRNKARMREGNLRNHLHVLDSLRHSGPSGVIDQLVSKIENEKMYVDQLTQEAEHLSNSTKELQCEVDRLRMYSEDLKAQVHADRDSEWDAMHERSRAIEREFERMREEDRMRSYEPISSHVDSNPPGSWFVADYSGSMSDSSGSWSDSGSSSSYDGGGSYGDSY
jgi:hypothetical protein